MYPTLLYPMKKEEEEEKTTILSCIRFLVQYIDLVEHTRRVATLRVFYVK